MKQKPARHYCPEREVFTGTLKCIKRTFGLDLSLIEKVRLRSTVSVVLDGLDMIEDRLMKPDLTYDPVGEAATRFMIDWYGLPKQLANVHTSFPPESAVYTENERGFCDLLKIKQEEAHHWV